MKTEPNIDTDTLFTYIRVHNNGVKDGMFNALRRVEDKRRTAFVFLFLSRYLFRRPVSERFNS